VRCYFFFSSRRRHTRFSRDWSSDVCSSDLELAQRQSAGEPLLAADGIPAGCLPPSTYIGPPDCLGEWISPGLSEDSTQRELGKRSEERRVGKEGRARCLLWHSVDKLLPIKH